MIADVATPSPRTGTTPTAIAALWFGLLAGPLAVLANEQIEYVTVFWSCGRFDAIGSVLLHAVPAVLILLCLSASLVAWRQRTTRLTTVAEVTAEDHDRRGFMVLIGIGLGVLSALTIAAQWMPVFYMGPCIRT